MTMSFIRVKIFMIFAISSLVKDIVERQLIVLFRESVGSFVLRILRISIVDYSALFSKDLSFFFEICNVLLSLYIGGIQGIFSLIKNLFNIYQYTFGLLQDSLTNSRFVKKTASCGIKSE